MLLRKADNLSPKITFYYSSYKSHKSKVSGILTLVQYLIMFIVSSYYLSIVIFRKNSTSFYYKTYIEDPGVIQINSSNFFHFLSFKNGFTYDPKAMSVIGAEMRPSQALKIQDENSIDHWIYNHCNFSLNVEENLKEILHGKEGLCITGFYNSTLKQTFDKEDNGFVYPTIQHGTGNNNSIPYGVFIRHCQNGTGRECYDEDKIIEKYSSLFSIVMNLVDHYVDVGNYKTPLNNFINSFESGVMKTTIMSSNSHFSPSLIKTHYGMIYDQVRLTEGYSFDQVVRGSYDKEESKMVAMFFFWMHNQISYYERKYLQFIDVLATISGLFKLTSSIFFVMNLFYHRFVVLNDFGEFLERSYSKLKKAKHFNIIKFKPHLHGTGLQLKINDMKKVGTSTLRTTHHKVTKKFYQKSRVTFMKVLLHFVRIRKNYYMTNLLKLRRKILSEEKMIKHYLSVKKFNQLFFDYPEKKCKTLNMLGTLIETMKKTNTETHSKHNGSKLSLIEENTEQ